MKKMTCHIEGVGWGKTERLLDLIVEESTKKVLYLCCNYENILEVVERLRKKHVHPFVFEGKQGPSGKCLREAGQQYIPG